MLRPSAYATGDSGKAAPPRLLRRRLLGALQAGRLSLQLAQVEEASALHPTAGNHLDLVDARREDRENALHSDSVGHLAHGEGAAQVALLLADDHALEDLDALLVALADLRVYPDRVADTEGGELRPRLRLDVTLLHQLDRLRAHLARSFDGSRGVSRRAILFQTAYSSTKIFAPSSAGSSSASSLRLFFVTESGRKN